MSVKAQLVVEYVAASIAVTWAMLVNWLVWIRPAILRRREARQRRRDWPRARAL